MSPPKKQGTQKLIRKGGKEALADIKFLEQLLESRDGNEPILPPCSTPRVVFENLDRFNEKYQFDSFKRQFKYLAKSTGFQERKGKYIL